MLSPFAYTQARTTSPNETEILNKLGSANPRIQQEAMRALDQKTLENPKIIRILAGMSADQSYQVSRNNDVIKEAKQTLAKLDLKNPVVKNEIIEIATKWHPGVSKSVIELLKKDNSEFEKFLKDFKELAFSPQTTDQTRQNFAQALDIAGPVADGFVDELFQKSLRASKIQEEQKISLEILSLVGRRKDKEFGPRIVSAIKFGTEEERLKALKAFPLFMTDASSVLPELIETIKEEDNEEIFSEAIKMLRTVGPNSKKLTPILGGMLKSEDSNEVFRAAFALNALGLFTKQNVESFVSLVQNLDTDWTIRVNALMILGALGEQAIPALDTILKTALADPDSEVRGAASQALGNLGVHAKSVLPDLIMALKSSSERVSNSAARAIGQMGEHAKTAIPNLEEALKKSYLQDSAANALGKMGEHSKPVVMRLIAKLDSEKRGELNRTIRILEEMGESAKIAIPRLKKLDPKNVDTGAVVRALAAMGDPGLLAETQKMESVDLKLESENLKYNAAFIFAKKLKRGEVFKETPVIPKSNQVSLEPEYVCERLCKLVDSTRNQTFGTKIYDRVGYADYIPHSADAAYANLDALFVTKASTICQTKENQMFLENQIKKYLNDSHKKQSEEFHEEGFSSLKIYTDQFDLLTVKDLISRRSELKLSETQLSKLFEHQKNLGENLSKNFERFEGIGGSAMNIYAQACTGIAGCGSPELLKNPDFQKTTQQLIDLAQENPTSLPYSMARNSFKDNKKGSAARAVPVNLLTYLMKPNDVDSQNNLVRALVNYDQHKELLVQHTLFHQGTHNRSQGGIAPYYFYSTIPYAMSALKVLKDSPSTKAENRARVLEIEKNLKTLLVRLIDDEKKAFRPHEVMLAKKNLYQASPAYANALGGISLLAAYGDECRSYFKIAPPPSEAPLIGILSGVDLRGLEAYRMKAPKDLSTDYKKPKIPTEKNH